MNMKILFIICVILCGTKSEEEWPKPFFLEPKQEGIYFQEFILFQPILVTEEIPWPFDLAILTYKGDKTPHIKIKDKKDLLNATIVRNENDWIIIVQNRQDYENEDQREYFFDVVVEEVDTQSIRVGLLNIFDNKPSVSYDPIPCEAEELKSNYENNCIFNVYDPDGMLNNNITLEIINNPDSHKFGFIKEPLDNYHVIFKMIIVEELEYVERSVYNLNVTAYDIERNNGSVLAVLQVKPVPHLPPKWIKPLPYAGFFEKSEQQFEVTAIDGDTGINTTICYSLYWSSKNYSDLIFIQSENGRGKLTVLPIDRDTLQQEIFQFDIRAFKCSNISSYIQNETIFMVEDINDHFPEIEIFPEVIEFMENKYIVVPFESFTVRDLDLGIHATYTVSLTNEVGIQYWEAFDLVPNSGYQNTTFRVSVGNATPVDYEDENWRQFKLNVFSQEIGDLSHNRTKEIQVNLLNWNDELPMFDKEAYSFSCLETVGKGFTFDENVHASDRDVDDFTTHEVSSYPGLTINKDSGAISTTVDKAFDYEQQNTVILQVKASDNLKNEYSSVTHTTFTQVTINVIDVNDKTPEIIFPKLAINLTENSIGMHLVTDKIKGQDPDSTANLTFTINWEESYASKAGKPTDFIDFKDCFVIKTHSTDSVNLVYGHLSVNSIFAATKEIDYEKFDVIYLAIKITDQNQEINDDSTEQILTIRILDVNDNAPEFIENTLVEDRQVVEEASIGTLVGTIAAIDIDGIGNNKIEYSLIPNGKLTQHGLLEINSTTGVIKVISDKIDCDLPVPIEFLEYEIVLTDGDWFTNGFIQVYIKDINNKKPIVYNEEFKQQIEVYENETTGYWIETVVASDADRDAPHHTLSFTINFLNSPELKNLFAINITTGNLTVNLVNGFELDRDNGVEYHEIYINIEDNYLGSGPVHTTQTYINVTLLDINDNAPEMPQTDAYQPKFEENDKKGTKDRIKFIAPDKDDPNLPNSWVMYEILEIWPKSDNMEGVYDYGNLFKMEGDGKEYGQMVANKDLQGYYGSWFVKILAYDQGIPQQKSNETYIVEVNPFNFNSPKIVFPDPNKSIRLCSEQDINQSLKTSDCANLLQKLEAYDPDGGIFGDIKFIVNGNNYFKTVKDPNYKNKSTLQLSQQIPSGVYSIDLTAEDGGLRSQTLNNLKIVLVDKNSSPVFEDNVLLTNFTEHGTGLKEERIIPEAIDPKNEGIDEANEDYYQVYYFIDETFLPDDNKFFTLDKNTRILSLVKPLDRTVQNLYELRIRVTNDIEGHIFNQISDTHILKVKIQVNIENPPVFIEKEYFGGVSSNDPKGKHILMVVAESPDPTNYFILPETIKTVGQNIEEFKNQMFTLDKDSGQVNLTTSVKDNMKGYFEFTVIALDLKENSNNDTAPVKIYVIAENNRINFEFSNNATHIESNQVYLRETLESVYGYDQCNIDDIEERQGKAVTSSSNVVTNVIVHFIHNDQPVDSEEVQQKSSHLPLISQLQNELVKKEMFIIGYPIPTIQKEKQSNEKALMISLIFVSVLFTLLIFLIVIAFILKMRKLKKQLKAYEPPKFGSVSSNLDIFGAPNTNIFSVEGSNPVIRNNFLNKRKDFDDSSSDSEGNDSFKGVSNDNNFKMSKNNEHGPRVSTIQNGIFAGITLQSNDDDEKYTSSESDEADDKFKLRY